MDRVGAYSGSLLYLEPVDGVTQVHLGDEMVRN